MSRFIRISPMLVATFAALTGCIDSPVLMPGMSTETEHGSEIPSPVSKLRIVDSPR